MNLTIGGGIFRPPAGVYDLVGPASPLVYAVCALLMGLIVLCFAEAGSRVSLTGGLYAYVEVAFGPLVGFVCGVLLWAGMTSAMAAIATFFADALAALVPALAGGAMHHVVVAAVLAGFAVLNIAGVAGAMRFNLVMTVAKLTPIVLVIAAGLLALQGDRLAIGAMPPLDKVARASVLLMFAFLGRGEFGAGAKRGGEGPVAHGAEGDRARAIRPGRDRLPLRPADRAVRAGSGARRLHDSGGRRRRRAARRLGRTLILVGSTISMFGNVGGMTLAVPRVLYAFARDGFLWKRLAYVHPRFRTPHGAIIVQTVLTVVLATTGGFEQLAIAANGAILIVFAACAAAVFELRRRDVRTAGTPFVAPLGGMVPALALVAIVALLWSLTPPEWLAMGLIVAGTIAVFAATRRSRAGARADDRSAAGVSAGVPDPCARELTGVELAGGDAAHRC